MTTFVLVVIGALQTSGCSAKSPSYAPVPAPSQASTPAQTALRFTQCLQHFPAAPPAVAAPARQRALCFDGYAVLYSGESKTPVYAVERLTRNSLSAANGLPRSDRFYSEARLPVADRAQLEDYRDSGYDRGHMALAGDMPTLAAKDQSFSLANMVPQHPRLNQQAWNQIEAATRKYAMRASGDVYVFTGPQFGRLPSAIGPNKVWVPAATWKVVYVPEERRSWAYWMSNDAGLHSIQPIPYSDYLKRGGPDVLPQTIH